MLSCTVFYCTVMQVVTEFGCEGSSVVLQCGEGERVEVVRANFGR